MFSYNYESYIMSQSEFLTESLTRIRSKGLSRQTFFNRRDIMSPISVTVWFLRYFVTWHLTRIFNSQNTGQGLTGTLKYALLYAKWSIRTLKHKKKTWSKTTDMNDSLFMTQPNWTFWKTEKNQLPSGWTVAQLKCTVRQTGYPTYGFSICYS